MTKWFIMLVLFKTSDKVESEESDYDDDRDQLEEEQKEEKTRETISATTTNQIF